MANLDKGLIKALQSIDANKEISDKFKSCSKENVYEMLRENGYNGSTQEFENLLSNIEKEIGDLLMQKKSDKDLSNVSGGKGANYFRKGLALGLTAISVGNIVQTGTFAAEVKQNANTKSFGEKAKEFFSKAKGKVYNFVDAHPGATLLLALGATNVANSFITWGLTKHHYNKKTQTEIKQEISGARAQLLATCKNVIDVESKTYEETLKAFETTVGNKVQEFKFDKELKTEDITVDAVNEFKALFGNVSEKSNVFNALSSVVGENLDAYIIGIKAGITKGLQNDLESKFVGLKTEQLNFLNTVIGYAENVVMLKKAEHIEKVTSEVTVAKQTIINNLKSIQEIISKQNEAAFTNNDSTWRGTTGNRDKANEYKAVVTNVRKGFENVLKSVFGDLKTACKVADIKKVVVALTFFEENIIDTDSGYKLKNLTDDISGINDGKTKSEEVADQGTVNDLAKAEDLKAFVNVILTALKDVTVGAEASGSAAKFEVVVKQADFLSSDEVAKNKLIDKITELITIKDLVAYKNETTEFENLEAAKAEFLKSGFVKKVDAWVAELQKNQGENKIFAATKLNNIKNLTVRVNAIADGTTLDKLAGEIDKAFNALIDEVKALFTSGDNFNGGYNASGVYDTVETKGQGIFANKYVDTFKLATKGLFKEKKKFEADKENLKKLYKDVNSLADHLENVEIGTSQLTKDANNDNGLEDKIGGNADNLKVLLLAMVGDALYAKLTNAFDGFDDLKRVEITKLSLEDKTKNGFSYKFFDKLNKFDDGSDEDIKAFQKWIEDTVLNTTTPGSENITKSIWDLIKEANDAK